MPDQPLAYFITFSTYGAWLHGDAKGSVDFGHNEFQTPFLAPDLAREQQEQGLMKQTPFLLDAPRRRIVLATIQEVCRHRRWVLLACHVRAKHIHIVVRADAPPGKVMNDFKAYASRRLNGAGFDDRKRLRWSRHGSTKYIWDEAYLGNAIHYTLQQQGEPMETYAASELRP